MPVNITEEFVRFLMKQNEEQSARIAELSAEITSLNQTCLLYTSMCFMI